MTTYKAPTDLDRQALRAMGHRIPACTADACGQGRGKCPCPNECRLPESDDEWQPLTLLETVTFWAGALAPLALVVCVALLAAMLPSK